MQRSGLICWSIFLILSKGKFILSGTHVFPEIRMGKIDEYISNDLLEKVSIIFFLKLFFLINCKIFKEYRRESE